MTGRQFRGRQSHSVRLTPVGNTRIHYNTQRSTIATQDYDTQMCPIVTTRIRYSTQIYTGTPNFLDIGTSSGPQTLYTHTCWVLVQLEQIIVQCGASLCYACTGPAAYAFLGSSQCIAVQWLQCSFHRSAMGRQKLGKAVLASSQQSDKL